jgi:hypothetical protein
MDGLKGLDEGILREVGRIFAIRGHVVHDPVDALPVFDDQTVEGRDVSGLNLPHDVEIGVSFLPALGRRNERLAENFGRFGHDRNQVQRGPGCKSNLVEAGLYPTRCKPATCAWRTSHNPSSKGVGA